MHKFSRFNSGIRVWRLTIFCIFILHFCSISSEAIDVKDVQRSLNGKWSGDGLTIIFDIDQLQANTEAEKPFQWESFHLLDVSGPMITFEIGPNQYVALLNTAGFMTVRKARFPSQWTLRRTAR